LVMAKRSSAPGIWVSCFSYRPRAYLDATAGNGSKIEGILVAFCLRGMALRYLFGDYILSDLSDCAVSFYEVSGLGRFRSFAVLLHFLEIQSFSVQIIIEMLQEIS
jgi:hypothetical protein